MKTLVFVHGWGFRPDFWSDLCRHLDGFEHQFVDLGFWGAERPYIDEKAVYVTHSMGLGWVLENVPRCAGVIVINGFTKFCAHEDWPEGVAPRMLDRMIRQFSKFPERVWTDFMKNCGLENPVIPSDYDPQALINGLKYLEKCDIREKFTALDCEKIIIAAENDKIVPQKLTIASFGERVIWYKEADHLLPLSRAEQLGQDIRRFLER